jgi:hypothetical protein
MIPGPEHFAGAPSGSGLDPQVRPRPRADEERGGDGHTAATASGPSAASGRTGVTPDALAPAAVKTPSASATAPTSRSPATRTNGDQTAAAEWWLAAGLRASAARARAPPRPATASARAHPGATAPPGWMRAATDRDRYRRP